MGDGRGPVTSPSVVCSGGNGRADELK